ncbi:hypothetical protein MJH12_19060, partial [bacterium]|nr:hypothetical protein [bacterium]
QDKSIQWIILMLHSPNNKCDTKLQEHLIAKRYRGQSFCKLWDELKLSLKSARTKLMNPAVEANVSEAMTYRVTRLKLLKVYLTESLDQLEIVELLDFTPKVGMDNELEDKIVEKVRQGVYKSEFDALPLINLYHQYCNRGWKQILLKPVFYNIRNKNLGKVSLEDIVKKTKNKEDLNDLRVLLYQEANSSMVFLQRIANYVMGIFGIKKKNEPKV